MSGKSWTWTVVPTGATAALPILDGSITVDATRNPQVSARLTVPFTSWTNAKRFDPFTRSEVVIEIRTTTHVGGTLTTFGQGTTPGTLATLDWSNKASNISRMGTASPRLETRRLRLFVTDVTADEMADTVEVTLASADSLLTEMVNFGQSWVPRPGSTTGGGQWALDDVWGEFFRVYDLPLWLDPSLADPATGYAWRTTIDPWETGADAWSWLNSVRTEVPGWRYVINTQTGQVSFLLNFGEVTAPSAIRSGATSVTVQRSVETSIEGLNQYADGIAIHWTDKTDRELPDQWEFANVHGDWRKMRRPFIEQRDMPSNTQTPPALAEARLARSQKFRRLTTVTQPISRVAGPFRDLSDHAWRSSVQSINYDYVSGDVTTTYLESDD